MTHISVNRNWFSEVDNVRILSKMPRHINGKAPWRHVKSLHTRDVRRDQKSPHIICNLVAWIGASVWTVTFQKSASRFFRYVTLSLQNGVLRSLGDTGARAPPTIKHESITLRMVLLIPGPVELPANQSIQRPLCDHCTKCRGSETSTSLFKFQPTYDVFPCCGGMWLSYTETIKLIHCPGVYSRLAVHHKGKKFVARYISWP